MLVLQFMWTKAAELLHNHQVLPAPGCSPLCCMLASKSTHKPHFVIANKDGHFECDDLCPNFAQRYICAHTVAVAENNSMLKGFIKSYGKFAKARKALLQTLPGCPWLICLTILQVERAINHQLRGQYHVEKQSLMNSNSQF